MLIKKLSAIAAISGICTLASTGFADETAELKEMLLQQQKQIEMLQKSADQLQKKVEKQETVHNEALTHYIKNEIDRALEAKGGNLLTLGGSHVEGLTIKGDYRFRYEYREDESGNDRDRFRQRFRLGFTWKTNEGWEIGAGLATGDNSATSTNQTVSATREFETGDIRLDYAYAKHSWDNGTSLTLGQHKNPYINAGLLWDSDVRFIGATGQWKSDDGFFATGGAYVVQTFENDTADNDDAEMLALQVGMTSGGFTGALTYYNFDSASNAANGVTGDNELRLASAYLEYAGKTDSFKYKVFAEYTINVGADDNTTSQVNSSNQEDEDQAWVIGGEVGVDQWKFKYMYAHMEADSAYGDLTNGDFGTALGNTNNSTNTKGHWFGVGYKVTKNFEIASTFILCEEIEGSTGDEGELFQLDFKYKF
ncbi:MAG: putative porin [Lentisphaeraceae bacterium]|nr:putative porin [Lentisphaeraceae bacterium]